MTTAQIMAVLSLLLAFNVPQSQVNSVQSILMKTQSMAVVTITEEGSSISNTLDCRPSLSATVVKEDGDISTGIDFMFYGTSTIPVGCPLDTSIENDIQFPTIFYHGKISDWKRNKQISFINNGFVFNSGWGTGSGITPSGQVNWYVGSSSISISI